jgi:hypothetical protein
MIEIFSILIHLIVITIFCYPSRWIILFFRNNKNINFIEKLEIGIVINIFFLLIISFFLRKNSNVVFYFILIFFLINLSSIIKDYFEFSKLKKFILNKEFIILFLLTFIFSINLSNNLKLGWDAQNFWLMKKLVFTNNGDIFDLQSTRMKSYPYLGSFLWFFYSKVSITGYEYFGRIFYIFLFLVSIFSAFSISKLDSVKFFLLTIATVFLIYDLSLFNGYQEILIFSLTVILVKTIYKYFNSFDKDDTFNNYSYFIGVIFLNILFIKNDALIIIFIFLLSLLLIKIKTFDKFKFLFIVIFIYFFKYNLFNYINLNNYLQEDNYQNISIIKLLDFFNLERMLLIIKYLFFASLDNPIFLVAGIFLLIMFKNNKNNIFYTFLLLSYLFSILFVFLAFFLTSLPIEFHLKTAASRLLFEISGFFLILIPLFFNKISYLKK